MSSIARGRSANAVALIPPSRDAASPSCRRGTEFQPQSFSALAAERKRATSSSSAFGSRARVRFLNLRKPNWRRPISFQAALRSLTSSNDSDDLAALAREHRKQDIGAEHQRHSFQGLVPFALPIQLGIRSIVVDPVGSVAVSHSSAPATTEVRHSSPTMAVTRTGDLSPRGPERLPQQKEKSMTVIDSPRLATAAAMSISHDDNQSATVPNTNSPQTVMLSDSAAGSTFQGEKAALKRGKNKPKFFLSASADKSFEDEEADEAEPPSVEAISQAVAVTAACRSVETSIEDAQAAQNAFKGARDEDASSSKQNRGKGDNTTARFSAGLTSGHRQKSSTHLPKAGKVKLGNRQGSSGRLTALHGLTMTKAQPVPAAAPAHKPSATKAPAAHPEAGRRKSHGKGLPARPVQFNLGPGDDEHDDSDEFRDEQDNGKAQSLAARHASNRPLKGAEEFVEDDDDDNAWASDASAEAEEERKNALKLAERRRRFELERQQDMFKKIPVRSKSAADVRHLLDPSAHPEPGSSEQTKAEEIQAPQQAPRGLLSSLFHPDEELRFPPGQLHGRLHASAADLRHTPHKDTMPSQPEKTSEKAGRASKTPAKSRPIYHRPPSLISGTPVNPVDNGGPLRSSKSAVALPVLNVANTASSARKGSTEEQFLSGSLVQQGTETQEAVQTGENITDHHRRPRDGSASSSASDAARREPLAAPAVAAHRSSMSAYFALQTPRTTRRNMLRDELSESLRQNLLWERQSRNRMLGIGANGPREPTTGRTQYAAPRANRRETILGGNTLRPLTQGPGPGAPTTGTSGGSGHCPSRAPTASTNLTTRSHHSRSTPSLPILSPEGMGQASAHRPQGHRQHTTQPFSQLSSAETTDDEDENHDDLARPEARVLHHGHIGEADTHNHHRRHENGRGATGAGGGKKKVMWPGGFPNYHQHGW